MSAWPSVAEVREAIRLDRSYAKARRAARRRDSANESPPLATRAIDGAIVAGYHLFMWGPPTCLAVLAVVQPESAWKLFGPACLIAINFVRLAAARVVQLHPFEALRAPSREAACAARLARHVPLLTAWSASLAIAAWAAASSMRPSFAFHDAAFSAGAAALPWLIAARTASAAAHERSGHAEQEWLGLLVWLVATGMLAAWLDLPRNDGWVVLVIWLSLGSHVRRDRLAHGVPRMIGDTAWVLALLTHTMAAPRPYATVPESVLPVSAAFFAVWPAVSTALLVRETLRDVRSMDLVAVEDGPATRGASRSATGLRRAPRGRGHWRATWEQALREETPGPFLREGPWGARIGDWAGTLMAWMVFGATVLVGPTLAVLGASGVAETTLGALGFGMMSVVTTRTLVSRRLCPRLYLLGVDYTVQVRQEMRALIRVAGPLVLGTALVAAAIRGFPETSIVCCATVAASLLLRIGTPGLVGERRRRAYLASVLLMFLVVALTSGRVDPMLTVVAAFAALGAVGWILRVMHLDEDRLRAAMCRAAETG